MPRQPTDEAIAVVHEVARRAQSDRGSLLARATTRAFGSWLLVHGSVLRGPAHGPPERDVTALLPRGLTIDDIGRTLSISRHTVRDHVKAVFAKLSVNSRAELTAKKLFYEHLLPAGTVTRPADERLRRHACPNGVCW